MRLELLPLLRILTPRLVSSTLLQMPELLRALPRHRQGKELVGPKPDYGRITSWSAHPRRLEGRAVEDVNHLQLPDEPHVPVDQRPCVPRACVALEMASNGLKMNKND